MGKVFPEGQAMKTTGHGKFFIKLLAAALTVLLLTVYSGEITGPLYILSGKIQVRIRDRA